ncbi:MAG: universal stress protein [Microbacterium sp.]|uniref:universal stress protein n=1 Tax=Microbacterium sp. TaxID=51671 RepID=UPI0039E3272C
MSDDTSREDSTGHADVPDAAVPPPDDPRLRGAVVAAVIPGQSPRVLTEAARYATLMGAPLLVVNVDVTRFVTYEDPDGYVHSAPIDLHVDSGVDDLQAVQKAAEAVLDGRDLVWGVHQLVGDPALAIKRLADRIDAKLIVVGTRKRGLGESIREFFTGSVAARLAHRQRRPILVVPLGDLVPDDESIWPE